MATTEVGEYSHNLNSIPIIFLQKVIYFYIYSRLLEHKRAVKTVVAALAQGRCILHGNTLWS